MRITSAIALAALGTLVLTGCTETEAESPLPEISTPASETANSPSSHVAELYGPDALLLSEYMRTYPAYTPAALRGVAFLIEEAATTTQVFPLPAEVDVERADSLILAIFCDADSPYEIAVMRDADIVDRTWGAQCPRSGIGLYTTAPLTGPTDSLTVRATVDEGTPYRLVVAAAAPMSR